LLLGFGLARGPARQRTTCAASSTCLAGPLPGPENYVEPRRTRSSSRGRSTGCSRPSIRTPSTSGRAAPADGRGVLGRILRRRDPVRPAATAPSWSSAALEGGPSYRLASRRRSHHRDRRQAAPKTMTNEDVSSSARPGRDSVAVTIERDGDAEPLHFSIDRAKIPIESVPYAYMLRPGIGYIRITRFAQTTGDELEKAPHQPAQAGHDLADARSARETPADSCRRRSRCSTNWCLRTNAWSTRAVASPGQRRLLHQRAREARQRPVVVTDRPRLGLRLGGSWPARCRIWIAGWSPASTPSARGWSRTSSGWATGRSSCSRSPSTTRRADG